MLGELSEAGQILKSALERYYNACAAVESYCHENEPSTTDSGRIFDELTFVRGLINTLIKAKISIKYSCNSSRHTVPINRLPYEIFIYILNLAIASGHEACKQHKSPYCYNPIHRQPETFASVCVRWRKLVLRCPTFWSRIDLAHTNQKGRKFVPRARLWAERSGSCPLDVRIAVRSYKYSSTTVSTNFLPSIASRELGSLSFILQGVNNIKEDSFFHQYLSNWEPGTLQKLVVEKTSLLDRSSRLIRSTDGGTHQDSQSYLRIDLPHEHLEAFWRPIKILRLYGMYIDWGSQAYHGLVELSLISSQGTYVNIATISESQLKAILTSSPGLRIFRFGLKVLPDISLTLPAGSTVEPVQLDDLQILDVDLQPRTEKSLPYILRWVSPGSKPLMLLLPRCHGSISESDLITQNRPEIDTFLRRAKVTELCIYTRAASIDWLLSLVPDLRTLSVSLGSISGNLVLTDECELSLSIPANTIDKLCTISSHLQMSSFSQWLSRLPPIGQLVFWSSTFIFSAGVTADAAKLLNHPQLLNICPDVKVSCEKLHSIIGLEPPRGYTY
ncbi:unnamed protein product [Rhizoctonia solani]|uniref:F-box domain-containing protein n=1 Tax=Rhizoctonia solani TaxID=456999 RepID=A0A8H3DC58_9AGAM|nr:unnamed protein product [Rhizoctonia solani]